MLITKVIAIIISFILFIIYCKYRLLRSDRISLVHGAKFCITVFHLEENEDWKYYNKDGTPLLTSDAHIQRGHDHYYVNLVLSDTITFSEKKSIHDQLHKLSDQFSFKKFAGTTLIIGKATFEFKKF
ncbi:unnamed protein product [Cunninghamella blakesleeana]